MVGSPRTMGASPCSPWGSRRTPGTSPARAGAPLSTVFSGSNAGGTNVGSNGNAVGSSAEELREALKLDLAAITVETKVHSKPGEVRPTWEFDLNEITLGHRIGAGAFGEVRWNAMPDAQSSSPKS